MIRKKLSLFLATLMVSTIAIGAVAESVYAAENVQASVQSNTNLKDGEYTVKNVTNYLDVNNTTGQSMARNVVLEDSTVKVENGVIKMTVKFNNSMYAFLKNIKVDLDGQVLSSQINENEKSITFELPSIDSKVLMKMNVSAMMNKEVSFYLQNDLNTLKLVKEAETNKRDENDKQVLSNGNYVLTNDVKYYKEGATESEIEHGYSAARGVLNSQTKVNVKDGKMIMTLSFNEQMYNFLKDIKVSVDGKELNGVNDKGERTLSFEVSSLDSQVMLSMGVTAMQKDVSFYVVNNVSTLQKISEDSEVGNDNSNNGSNMPNNGASNNESKDEQVKENNTESISNNAGTAVEEETNVKEQVTVREYTIQNNVTHPSETGVAMARKYLNKTSHVKEVNGKYYVTLTFTGREFMNNHKIYVNGSLVDATVVSSDANNISLRFPVSKLTDNIKVSTYVVPMSRNVEFGVQLLPDTLSLVKEYTVAPEEVKNELTLPSTGDFTSVALPILGLATSGAGVVLSRKRK